MLFANHLILFGPKNAGASGVNMLLRLLLQVKMFKNIPANNILVKADPLLTKWVQVATSIDTGLQIRLKLLT